jgi:hypothetical protein
MNKLDGIGESIVLSFVHPNMNTPELLKSRGTRGGVDQ